MKKKVEPKPSIECIQESFPSQELFPEKYFKYNQKYISTSGDATVVKLVLHGDLSTNTLIVSAFVDFILLSKQFDVPFM